LREEHRLRVFENRVPRRIFGPKKNEVTGEWRKLHNEELNDLYLLNYLLTPLSRILLEKLTGSQLFKKFPAFYGAQKFITAFTRASHLSLS
jgi:hypothetical protein